MAKTGKPFLPPKSGIYTHMANIRKNLSHSTARTRKAYQCDTTSAFVRLFETKQ
jgi:hypothetical protein